MLWSLGQGLNDLVSDHIDGRNAICSIYHCSCFISTVWPSYDNVSTPTSRVTIPHRTSTTDNARESGGKGLWPCCLVVVLWRRFDVKIRHTQWESSLLSLAPVISLLPPAPFEVPTASKSTRNYSHRSSKGKFRVSSENATMLGR